MAHWQGLKPQSEVVQRGIAAQIRQRDDNSGKTLLRREDRRFLNQVIHDSALEHDPQFDERLKYIAEYSGSNVHSTHGERDGLSDALSTGLMVFGALATLGAGAYSAYQERQRRNEMERQRKEMERLRKEREFHRQMQQLMFVAAAIFALIVFGLWYTGWLYYVILACSALWLDCNRFVGFKLHFFEGHPAAPHAGVHAMDISRISKLGKIFRKKKGLDLRPQSVYDLQKFRDLFLAASARHNCRVPPCIDKMIYKAISAQKNITSMDFHQEGIEDDAVLALMETLLEMPLVSTLDLRENAITDRGVRAILELMRHQLVLARGSAHATTKPLPEFTRFLTCVHLKGNNVSDSAMQQVRQYSSMLRVEDKRLEIQAVLNQIDYNDAGGVDEGEIRVALKLCSGGSEPAKKDVDYFADHLSSVTWHVTGDADASKILSNTRSSVETLLLAKYAKSPSKKDTAGMPPLDSLAHIRHAELVNPLAKPEQPPYRLGDEIMRDDEQSPRRNSSSPEKEPSSFSASSRDLRLPRTSNASMHESEASPTSRTQDADVSMIHPMPVEDPRPCFPLDDHLEENNHRGGEGVHRDDEPDAGDDEEQVDDAPDEHEDEEALEITTEHVIEEEEAAAVESLNASPIEMEEHFHADEQEIVDGDDASEVVAVEPPVDETIREFCLMDQVQLQQQSRTVVKLQHGRIRAGDALDRLFDSVYFDNVVALVLSNNQLQSMEPLRALRVLDLSRNQLTKLNATELVKVRHVEVLDLSYNGFTSICGIENLTKLRALSYEGNSIRCAKNLECLERLEILNLAHNAIHVPQSLRLLSMNKLLSHLNIDENPIVQAGTGRKVSAHIINIIPTLRSLGCIHLASLVVKEKTKKSTLPPPPEEPVRSSIFEFLDAAPPRPWVDQACEMLCIVCDHPEVSASPEAPKISRTLQKTKDEQRSKALPHHIARKTPPATPPPPPLPQPISKPTISFSDQQRKAVALSTPRVFKPPPKAPQMCHPPRISKPPPSSSASGSAKPTVAVVLTNKGFLQPTKASLHAHAEHKKERDKAKKKKKPANILYKRLKRREEQLRHVMATSPVKLAAAPAPAPSSDPPVLALPTWTPPSRETSPIKLGSLAITSTDTFLAQIRLNDFVTLVTEDHATASTALDVLVAMCEQPSDDGAKFTAYKANLESLHILDDVAVTCATQEALDMAQAQSNEPLPVLARLDELKRIKQTLKLVVDHVESTSAPLGSSSLLNVCLQVRNGPLGHLLSPCEERQETQQGTPTPVETTSSLDLLSPVNATTTTHLFDSTTDDPFGLTDTEPAAATSIDTAAVHLTTQSTDPPADAAPLDLALDAAFELEASLDNAEPASSPLGLDETPEAVHELVDPILTENEEVNETVDAPSPVLSNEDFPDDEHEEAEEMEEVHAEEPEQVELVDEVEEEAAEEEGSDAPLTWGDWEQGYDPSTNHHYWFNNATDESSWTPPEGWPHALDDGAEEEAEEQDEEEEDDAVEEDATEQVQELDVELSLEDRIALALGGGSAAPPPACSMDDDGDAVMFDDDAFPDL
ncbi:hypothetical protein Ae201684P_021027 [Aphanomyces euteiches]|nr:hypothetical protein Ae201684P_021027 [Aphanomyces euteiches]